MKRQPTKKQLAALARGRAKRRKKRTERERRALGYRRERKATMARKKKRASAPRRRRSAPRRRRVSRRGGGGGVFGGIEWKSMAGAAAYGFLERQAVEKKDEALLRKMPLFAPQVGYAGCSAIAAHFLGKQVGGTIGGLLRAYARGTFDVAAYKLARHGKLYENESDALEALTSLSGDDDMGWDDPDEVGIELEGDDIGYGADGIAGDDD